MKLNGLRLDGKFADSGAMTWAHAKNILLSRGFDEIENEPGEDYYNSVQGGILGRIVVPNAILIFSWDGAYGYITYIESDTTSVELVIQGGGAGTEFLNFDYTTAPYKYVEGVHCYNNKGDLIVAWTLGYGKPMIMNVTEAITTPIEIASEDDLKQLYLFPEFGHNNFNLTNSSANTTSSVINGGRLPSAAYFISLAYELDEDVLTNFGLISNPIFISEDDILTIYKQFKGNASLVVTNKAISINVTNLDTTKSYFKLAIIQRTTSSTTTYITKRVKVKSGTVSVLIDDLDKLSLFNTAEVITSSPGYIDVKTITNINKRLRIGNVSKPTKLSLTNIYDEILTPREFSVMRASRTASAIVNVVCLLPHNLATGQVVTMNGWNIASYNGHFEITVDSSNSFYYTSTVNTTDAASNGTAKVDILDINWICDTNTSLSSTRGSYKDPVFIFNNRGFRSDEVYALYLGLRLKTGGYYGIYHIPGREPLGTENTNQTAVDGVNIDNYKLASTASMQGNYYGKMGFWENENETYQDNYGLKLADNKVRHHRFPSAGQINSFTGGYLNTTKKGNLVEALTFTTPSTYEIGSTDLLYVILPLVNEPALGVYSPASLSPLQYINTYTATYAQVLELNFSLGIRIIDTAAVGSTATVSITKYTKTPSGYTTDVLYGPTTQATTALDDTLTFTHTENVELNVEDYIAFQVEIQQLSTHAPAGTPGFTNNTTLNIYEATIGQPIIGLRISLDWDNITSSIKEDLEEIIDGWEILYAKRTLNNQIMLDQSLVFKDASGYRFYGFDSMVNQLNIQPTHIKAEFNIQPTDYIDGAYIKEITNYTAQAVTYSEVSETKYLPAYNSATVPSNENKENCYYFTTKSGLFDKRLVNFLNIKNDLYLDFSNQELVSTGIIKTLQQQSAFSLYGGDSYINHNSVLTFVLSGTDYIPCIWYFPVENVLNAGMRYEGENDFEKFFPLTDITKFFTVGSDSVQSFILAMKAAGIANYYFYNDDYHLLNNIRQDIIDNELTDLLGVYKNRIHSSMPQIEQSNSIYWRKFRPLDYFDMVNQKDEIYKMLGNEYIVYIQTRFSIFRGIIVDQLTTQNINVALKTTEMFDRPLQELLDADGTYIQPWNKEGTILTPFGLVVVDIHKGSIYIISDKLNEISKLGIEDWFRKTIKNRIRFEDKEKIGTGVSLGYDDLYKRLLVTIKDKSFTFANKFGFLYNWYAATDARGIAAEGWHLPTLEEAQTLIDYHGGNEIAGTKMRETGSVYWDSEAEGFIEGTNDYGFNVRGAGSRQYHMSGEFIGLRINTAMWLNTFAGIGFWVNADMAYAEIIEVEESKKNGAPIRLIKDSTTLSHGETGTYTGNDGKVYRTICIGTQEWLADNLAEIKYRNGDAIPVVTDNATWATLVTGARCSYDNDEDNAYSVIGYRNSFTLSFSFEKMMWLCFHDYIFDKYCWNSKGLFGINDSNIYKLLSNNKGYYNNMYYPSTIDFIFNNNRGKRFLLENINWITNVELDGVNIWNETISKLFVYSKHFATLITNIVKKEFGYNSVTHQLEESGNTIYQDGRWTFNDIKDYLSSLENRILDENFDVIDASLDAGKSEFNLSKFISEFVIVRMIYDNTYDNKKFKISDIQINIKKILS